MLFNTQNFAIFFAATLVVYWLFYKWRNVQNLILLTANTYFYYNFHQSLPVYLTILIGISYCSALIIDSIEDPKLKKAALGITICLQGLGLLYIKYSNLILGNIPGLDQWQSSALHVIIPIGISYFTFSTIGYVVDVYRKTTPVEQDFVVYASYISFFPHILCGPIPSSATLLPQFKKSQIPDWRTLELSASEIIWGLFKKMVVADNTILAVNYCFAQYADLNGSTLFLGVLLFSFYIYADFSGYSDIARGVSRFMGIELVRNFRTPLFARNPGELWRRWHTSLRKWMLDYLYLPLGGNKGTKLRYIGLMFFIFAFSGLWHGANVTFVFWGIINGMYFLAYILTNNLVRYKTGPSPGKIFPTIGEFGKILFTLLLATIMRIFFRSPNIFVAKEFFMKIFSLSIFEAPMMLVVQQFVWCVPMLVLEWIQREKDYFLDIGSKNIVIRLALYGIVVAAISYFCRKQSATECYYFKF